MFKNYTRIALVAMTILLIGSVLACRFWPEEPKFTTVYYPLRAKVVGELQFRTYEAMTEYVADHLARPEGFKVLSTSQEPEEIKVHSHVINDTTYHFWVGERYFPDSMNLSGNYWGGGRYDAYDAYNYRLRVSYYASETIMEVSK